MERVAYDEFGLFGENAAEFGLPFDRPPVVRRESVAVEGGRRLSALVWGEGEPELVLLHGGAQNAHTWDTVALALGRPLVAVDLPGHGHSGDARADGPGGASGLAADVASAVAALAPRAGRVVGMSLGGLTTLALYARAPELVRRIVLVDVLPSVNPDKAKLITDFVNGPPTFPSFDELLARTVEHNPTRTESALRRGILHNAQQLDDGSWRWRHHRRRPEEGSGPVPSPEERAAAMAELWEVVSGVTVPLLLVRGMASSSVLDDSHESELLRRLPTARVERVQGAGHSIQGDKPIELARLIDEFIRL